MNPTYTVSISVKASAMLICSNLYHYVQHGPPHKTLGTMASMPLKLSQPKPHLPLHSSEAVLQCLLQRCSQCSVSAGLALSGWQEEERGQGGPRLSFWAAWQNQQRDQSARCTPPSKSNGVAGCLSALLSSSAVMCCASGLGGAAKVKYGPAVTFTDGACVFTL